MSLDSLHIVWYVNNIFSPVRRRSWFQRLTSNGVVLGLIIANVAVFLAWRVADPVFMSENFTVSFLIYKI